MSSSRSSVDRLFTPPRDLGGELAPSEAPEPPPSSSGGPPSHETSPLTSITPSSRSSRTPRAEVWVEVPRFPPEVLEQYKDISERDLSFEEAIPESMMECIIGEHKFGSKTYYYVKLSDGLAYRLEAERFRTDHPFLVKEYERKKEAGELAPFDPSASYVHPKSRVKVVIKLKRSPPQIEDTPLSEAETDELVISGETRLDDSDDEDAYVESDASEVPIRRSTRAAAGSKAKKQLTLPFSPKKASSRKVRTASDEEDLGGEDVPLAATTRRSTRSKKATRAVLDEDDYEEFDSNDEFVQGRSTGSAKPKKAVRKKGSRPAYGHFRPIADLDYDEDEATALLRAHRTWCEKCERKPTHLLLKDKRKSKPKRRRKSNNSDEESEDDSEDRLNALGGWVRCLKCPLSAHWSCLARTQRDEILRAALEKDKAEWRAAHASAQAPDSEESQDAPKPMPPEPTKHSALGADQTTEFICGQCMRGGTCMGCLEVALEPDVSRVTPGEKPKDDADVQRKDTDGDVQMADASKEPEKPPEKAPDEPAKELLFRCWTCKRIAHYAHLPLSQFADPEEEYTALDRAYYYQTKTKWQCADCVSFVYTVEHILAWRPFPPNSIEPPLPPGEVPNYKAHLPREYLVKWISRSYRRTQWVPHMWLVATHPAKLKNFLSNGSRVALLPEPVPDAVAEAVIQVDEHETQFGAAEEEGHEEAEASSVAVSASDPIPDADRRIQPAWKTVDRVLDVVLWSPDKRLKAARSKIAKARKGKKGAAKRVESDAEDLQKAQIEIDREYKAAFEEGEQPSADLTETVDEWEERTGQELTLDDIDLVVWGFFKWHDLGYDDATWDSPPRTDKDSPSFKAFEKGFARLLASRQVTVKAHTRKEVEMMDHQIPKNIFMRRFAYTQDTQPKLGQDTAKYSLMNFQVDGVNWLCNNWFNRQHCILADEMGLGKTVQIVMFLGAVIQGGFKDYETVKAQPALVVVPNSTITNWVREFERWAPRLRVVPFYGEAKSRDIIRKYELFHDFVEKGTTGAKYDVLVTTYETITNTKEFAPVFKATPRWEVLVVDEGQRLKSDSSLIFRKLKELNTVHRIILTGTPLNNNIRELFNLMNFLDPVEWNDLENLAKEHEVLTEESVKELHTRLRPYFLRRVKSEVLELPPKNEVIVPVTMSPLQKEVYRSILSQNLELLRSLAQSISGAKVSAAIKKSNMNNMLMQLRKCLQHPYLVSREIEPKGLSLTEAHEKLVWASAKLRLLQTLLPKLKERGHRVLLFSQFVMVLDIVEDFLNGEGIKFLRLDGNTKQADRQKDMDEFNNPDSDVFIYILSTRAGGVGINLWTADTVIIFDPDFNPHQDLQAIARAHRYGQKKTCLVFKLMVKDSAEERIMQTGKKKLVLDHLIVQKMDDDDDAEDVRSMLMFGAQALFQESDDQAKEMHYSEHDVVNLIEKTEKEGDQPEQKPGEGMAFSFAKVWAAEKDSLDDMDDVEAQAQDQAWTKTLARIEEENAKQQAMEVTGRLAKRKAAAVFAKSSTKTTLDDSPKDKRKKGKGKSKATVSDDDAYIEAPPDSGSESSGPDSASEEQLAGLAPEVAELIRQKKARHKSRYIVDIARGQDDHGPLSPILNRPDLARDAVVCGLCGLNHPDAQCFMTESSDNLAQYRNILLTHSGDEPLHVRQAAIDVIDETLYKRGALHLIYGQPLHPVDSPVRVRTPHRTHEQPHPPPPLPRQQGPGPAPADRTSQPQATAPRTMNGSVPGPAALKRAASPRLRAEPPRKKMKESAPPQCVVCGLSPPHPLDACPAIAQGSGRIEKELRRLQGDPTIPQSVIISLSQVLVQQRQRELAAAGGRGVPPQ